VFIYSCLQLVPFNRPDYLTKTMKIQISYKKTMGVFEINQPGRDYLPKKYKLKNFNQSKLTVSKQKRKTVETSFFPRS
jgi:hypothetical protein